jgi:hypothetical protein
MHKLFFLLLLLILFLRQGLATFAQADLKLAIFLSLLPKELRLQVCLTTPGLARLFIEMKYPGIGSG